MWQGGGEEGERERETHSLTHRVKDWDLVMCVAGRRGGGREGTRDTHSLTHREDWDLYSISAQLAAVLTLITSSYFMLWI